MSREVFIASNIKCGGCVANIRQGLLALDGVTEVEVDQASGRVDVSGEQVDRATITSKLAELGYPVAG